MKRNGLTLLIALLLVNQLEAKKIEGFIINKEDTLKVTLKVPIKFFTQEPNYEKLQSKVKYYDSTGTKRTLRADEADEIRFIYENKEIRMRSKEDSHGLGALFSRSDKIFLRLLVDGDLKLFKYYNTHSSPGVYNASTGVTTGGYTTKNDRYFLQKGSDGLFMVRGLYFKNEMSTYFKDCPLLSEKILNKDFRRRDIELIVEYYQNNCK